ncbi:hypothetical protein KC865_02775 [Candidatus Kaiserbacteria bacterium]|nr:hypothetical protein [Candidatus Kaiserbacteria bacterium]USN92707.1 MAG: hypothetical protein H6782_02750 [Candidatus Nomurabacteria bacterium]
MDYNLYGSIEHSVTSLWVDMVQFAPQLVVAILVLIVGWIIGGVFSGIIRRGFKTLHIDDALDKAGVDNLSKKAGYDFKPGYFAGSLVKWFVFLAFAVVAFDILGLGEVNIFMREVVLGYLPQVFVAVLILFAAMLIADVASKALVAALRTSGAGNPEFFGKVAYYLVIVFAVLAVLNQLQIADELVQTLFTGVVFALSLAGGLAFGLGGKEAAGRYIDRMTRQ